jgi:uncharacterized protein YoxC
VRSLSRKARRLVEEVHSLVERPRYLFDEVDRLVEKPRCLLDEVDRLIKRVDRLVEKPRCLLDEVDGLVDEPRCLFDEVDRLVEKPRCLLDEVDRLVEKPRCLLDEIDRLVDEPRCLLDEVDRLIKRVDRLVEKPRCLLDEPRCLLDEVDRLLEKVDRLLEKVDRLLEKVDRLLEKVDRFRTEGGDSVRIGSAPERDALPTRRRARFSSGAGAEHLAGDEGAPLRELVQGEVPLDEGLVVEGPRADALLIVEAEPVDRRLHARPRRVVEVGARQDLEERQLQDEPAVGDFDGVEHVLERVLARVHEQAHEAVVGPLEREVPALRLRRRVIDRRRTRAARDEDAEVGADPAVALVEVGEDRAPERREGILPLRDGA